MIALAGNPPVLSTGMSMQPASAELALTSAAPRVRVVPLVFFVKEDMPLAILLPPQSAYSTYRARGPPCEDNLLLGKFVTEARTANSRLGFRASEETAHG